MAKKTSLTAAVSNIVRDNGAGIFKNPGALRQLLILQGIPEGTAITTELILSSCPALGNALVAGNISRMEANNLVSIVMQTTSLTPAITREILGELFMGRGVDASSYRVAGELNRDSVMGRIAENLLKRNYRWSLIDETEHDSVARARRKLHEMNWGGWDDLALSELDRLAEEGNAEANYAIGEYFYELSADSDAIPQDDSNFEQAHRYMERSAKLGYGPAYGALAEMEIVSGKGSLEKAAGYLEHPVSIKGSDGRRWSHTVEWMMNYQHENDRRADRVLVVTLAAIIVSFFAYLVKPVFGIAGVVLSSICIVRAVFSKFWNKYQSHVPEMIIMTLIWFMMILALL